DVGVHGLANGRAAPGVGDHVDVEAAAGAGPAQGAASGKAPPPHPGLENVALPCGDQHLGPARAAAAEPAAKAAAGRPVEVAIRIVAVAEPRIAATDDVVVTERHVDLSHH